MIEQGKKKKKNYSRIFINVAIDKNPIGGFSRVSKRQQEHGLLSRFNKRNPNKVYSHVFRNATMGPNL